MWTAPGRTCQTCFLVLLAIGGVFLVMGLLVEPVRPDFQLDRVLTAEELRDKTRRDATLALLKKAAGNGWMFWTAGGLAVVVTSAVGLGTVRDAEWQKIRSDSHSQR